MAYEKSGAGLTIFELHKLYMCDFTETKGDFIVLALRREGDKLTIDLPVHGKRICKVSEIDGVEIVYPFGRYFNAPILKASNLITN